MQSVSTNFRLASSVTCLLRHAVAGSPLAGIASSCQSGLPAASSDLPCSTDCCSATLALQSRRFSGSSASASSDAPKPRRQRRSPDAWKARMPKGEGRYATRLREQNPQLFERMRLVLGFYDLPENAHLPRPSPPQSATLSILQTLRHTPDADAYYKLALLSYRSKELNRTVAASAARVQQFLDGLEAQAAAFVPHIPGSSSSGGGGGGGGGAAGGGSGPAGGSSSAAPAGGAVQPAADG